MSTTLSFIGKQVTIYLGTTLLITGVVGGLLNILVFLSLRTFRQSSCAFYLTIMSIANICTLLIGIVSRIYSILSGIDPNETSLFYCKARLYFNQICGGISLTCWCLATIDQYFATCSHPRWQQWCNIKLARRLLIITVIHWTLHSIPCLLFRGHVVSSVTKKVTCTDTNYIFEHYRAYVILLGLLGYIPIFVATIFGLMAFYNVKRIAYRAVPLVRRELDKQLTVMVLVQVVVSTFSLLPYTTVNAVATNKNLTSDPVIQEKLQFTVTVTLILFYLNFSSPFYVYICASERFRQQLIHVLFKTHRHQCQPRKTNTNQVIPEI